MLKMKATACIEASVKETWLALSDVENIVHWAEPVLLAKCISSIKQGVGAERICTLKGNIEILEKWTEWDEGKSFTYHGYGLPLVKTAKNKWSVQAYEGKTLVISEAEVELKGGVFGRFFEPLLKIVSLKMSADTLAAFKYLVENGQPFKGKFSALPRVSPLC